MSIPELLAALQEAEAQPLPHDQVLTLVLPKGWRRPRGFPRGELLCENMDGDRVYRFDAWRLRKFLTAWGMTPYKEDTAALEEETA